MDYGQLVLATTILKKAQEVAEGKTIIDIRLLVPKPFDMAKFVLKACYRFTRDIKVEASAVAYFLFN